MVKEWSNQYNPFNSSKLFSHIPRWTEIKDGKYLPAPALVTVDPTNICNLDCIWCNADYIRTSNPKKMSNETLDEIADFLPRWGKNDRWKGVEAMCIAGGGEPLSHPYTGKFIEKAVGNGVETGIVTNGTLINRHLEYLKACTWVGVSVDAGTREAFKNLKGSDSYVKVLSNIEKLANSVSSNDPLGAPGQGPGISYKFLMHPGNVKDVYIATKNAKNAGAKNVHIRPFGVTWDKVGQEVPAEFSYSDIEEFKTQIDKARDLEDDNFKVFGITHKFDGNFKKANQFDSCNAIYMTAVLQPSTDDSGNLDLGLCCDRRGDSKLTFKNLKSPEEINELWGNEDHKKMIDKIDVSKCPRCTYQPHNQIFENVIDMDNMTWKFI